MIQQLTMGNQTKWTLTWDWFHRLLYASQTLKCKNFKVDEFKGMNQSRRRILTINWNRIVTSPWQSRTKTRWTYFRSLLSLNSRFKILKNQREILKWGLLSAETIITILHLTMEKKGANIFKIKIKKTK